MGYPKELKAMAMVLQRMMAPGNEAIGVLAKEFNVTEATLYAWRREALKAGAVVGGTGAVPEQWSGAVTDRHNRATSDRHIGASLNRL